MSERARWSDLDKGVGLFSFARYTDGVSSGSPTFLRRCGMVLCHEATHCFGVRHCVYASCLMNGSNHLEESESRVSAALDPPTSGWSHIQIALCNVMMPCAPSDGPVAVAPFRRPLLGVPR